jgi:transcriptional regulator with XRE-family HTH domain
MPEKKITRLVLTDDIPLPKILKRLRLKKGITMSQLGSALGKSGQQISRYETDESGYDHQFPPIPILRNICIFFQIDPKDLLGIDTVDCGKEPEAGVIYEWEQKGDSVYWTCPNCKGRNVTYGHYKGKKVEAIKGLGFECEYDGCGYYFDKLYVEKSKTGKNVI